MDFDTSVFQDMSSGYRSKILLEPGFSTGSGIVFLRMACCKRPQRLRAKLGELSLLLLLLAVLLMAVDRVEITSVECLKVVATIACSEELAEDGNLEDRK